MRAVRILALIVAAFATCVPLRTADAGWWNWCKPTPVVNHINRFIGVGWSDGYHAYGSRNSWVKPAKHGGVRYAMPGTVWHDAGPTEMSFEQFEQIETPLEAPVQAPPRKQPPSRLTPKPAP